MMNPCTPRTPTRCYYCIEIVCPNDRIIDRTNGAFRLFHPGCLDRWMQTAAGMQEREIAFGESDIQTDAAAVAQESLGLRDNEIFTFYDQRYYGMHPSDFTFIDDRDISLENMIDGELAYFFNHTVANRTSGNDSSGPSTRMLPYQVVPYTTDEGPSLTSQSYHFETITGFTGTPWRHASAHRNEAHVLDVAIQTPAEVQREHHTEVQVLPANNSNIQATGSQSEAGSSSDGSSFSESEEGLWL